MRAVQNLTISVRLRDIHRSEMKRQSRAVNLVWNYCNDVSRKAWADRKEFLSGYKLVGLTSGSSEHLDIHSHSIQKVCHYFDTRRRQAGKSGLRWRGRKSLGWVPFNTGSVKFNGKGFIFRKIEYKPMHLPKRLSRSIKILDGSFSEDRSGNWYINLNVLCNVDEKSATKSVGIDLGLKDFIVTSEGQKVETPRFYRRSEETLALSQRAKKTKRTRAIHNKIANRRKDFLHKESKKFAKAYGLVVIGDVSSSKLAKTRLAKSIMDAGWSDFKRMLSYKAVMHGGRMIEVSEAYTSQTCSRCGSLPHGRPAGIAGLGIREWECNDCGTVHDRDVNAARNILRVGLDTLVEGAAQMRSSQGRKVAT